MIKMKCSDSSLATSWTIGSSTIWNSSWMKWSKVRLVLFGLMSSERFSLLISRERPRQILFTRSYFHLSQFNKMVTLIVCLMPQLMQIKLLTWSLFRNWPSSLTALTLVQLTSLILTLKTIQMRWLMSWLQTSREVLLRRMMGLFGKTNQLRNSVFSSCSNWCRTNFMSDLEIYVKLSDTWIQITRSLSLSMSGLKRLTFSVWRLVLMILPNYSATWIQMEMVLLPMTNLHCCRKKSGAK